MYIPLSTMAGPRRPMPWTPPPEPAMPSDPAALLVYAARLDRVADAELAEGRWRQAERLSHAALEARARANGGRA